jgi:putative peptidoglycan lipid II flippase
VQLLRNFATVGAWTLVSRVLGFVRDVLTAAVLGAGPVSDAFFVAFKLPNLFRRLFAEGAFNSAFVPQYARARAEEGEAGSHLFASQVLAWLAVILTAVSALAMIFTPALVLVLAPGFADDPAKFDLTVLYTRVCFPYLAAMSLVAFLSGVLNTLDRFAEAALAPVLLNVVLIAFLLAIAQLPLERWEEGLLLTVGVFVAGVVQGTLLVVSVLRAGIRLRLVRPRRSARLGRLLRVMIPGVAAGGITQINIAAGTIIASFWPGAVSSLYYADRLYQLPLGVVGVAIGVALLPDLSRRLGSGDAGGALWTQNRALEFALLLTLPCAAALVAVPLEIIVALFERGAFTRADSIMTAAALAAYGVGLPAFVLVKVLSPGYFAREDTRTPMIYAGVSMVVNVVAAVGLAVLLAPQGYANVGIAAATSIAAWVNTACLAVGLVRRGHFVADKALRTRLLGFVAASLALAVVAVVVAKALSAWFFGGDTLRTLLALAILVGGAGLAYALVCQLSGAFGVRDLVKAFRRG